MKPLATALAVLSLAALARADVIHVPADFASLQDAADAAAPGDEIVIAPGEYEGVMTIDAKTDLTVRGQGKVTLLGSMPGVANLRVQNSSNIVLERLRVLGSEGNGLELAACDGISLVQCHVEGSAGDGVNVQDCQTVLLDRVVVSGSAGAGVRATGSDTVQLSRCKILGGDTGAEIADGAGHALDRVTVSGTADRGIGLGALGVTGVTDAAVSRCRVLGAGAVGLALKGTGLLAEKNRVIGSATAGLLVFDGACILRDNRLIGAGTIGLDVVGGTHVILDNRIMKAAQIGLKVDHAGPQFLSGNRIVKAGDTGLDLDDGNDGSVLTDNVVSGTPNGLDVFSNEVAGSGNRVSGATHTGFLVQGTGGVFTGNRATGSGDFDLFDGSNFGNTYVDNVFGTTHFE